MRIIKPGVKPEDRMHRHECHNCNAIFEFSASEAASESGVSGGAPGREGSALRVVCPCCAMGTWVLVVSQFKPWIMPEKTRDAFLPQLQAVGYSLQQP